MATTIVHDSSEAVELCSHRGLYLKPIAKLAITVFWPDQREPIKAVSNWEVMARLKQMAHPHQFISIRVSKSTQEFVRFEAELETRALVQVLCLKLNGQTLEVQGCSRALKILAVESCPDFPTRQDWESYFQDREGRPDTVHLEGLPCKWFSSPDSRSQKPMEKIVREVFGCFGPIRNMDIPALDFYREETGGRVSTAFSFTGLQTFDAYLQFQEYEDFLKAMESFRGMKLMLKEGDGKALACTIKVTFDMTNHLSEAAVARRQHERRQLEELEEQRQREKRREREEEEADRIRKESQREKKRQEKLRRRAERQREASEKRLFATRDVVQDMEEDDDWMEEEVWEERKLVLAQRRLQSIRLLTSLLQKVQDLTKQKTEKKSLKTEKSSCDDPDSPDEITEEIVASKRVWGINSIMNKPITSLTEPVVCPPDTTIPDSITDDLSSSHAILSHEHPSQCFNYGPLQVTICQSHSNRDLSQHSQTTSSQRTQNSSSPFRRIASSKEYFSTRHKKKEKIYESEEFMNFLLNHYSHPTYARLCQSPQSSPASSWQRVVSDNGKGYQISLMNMDGGFCTEVSISQNARKINRSDEDRYKWKITIKEREPSRRMTGIQRSPSQGYGREFEVCWNESSMHCATEDPEYVHTLEDLSPLQNFTVKDYDSVSHREFAKKRKPTSLTSFHQRTFSTDAQVQIFGESKLLEVVPEKAHLEGQRKTQINIEKTDSLSKGYEEKVSKVSIPEDGEAKEKICEDEGEVCPLSKEGDAPGVAKAGRKKSKKKRKKSKGCVSGSDAETSQANKKRKKKKKNKHKNSKGEKRVEELEKRKKGRLSEWDQLHHKQKQGTSEHRYSLWDKQHMKAKTISYPKPWNGFGNRYNYGNEFGGWNYYYVKPHKRFDSSRGFANETDNPGAKPSSWYAGGRYADINQNLDIVPKKKKKEN
nr:PREDICTED: uncharacterized protein LOC102682235 [Lepisosteus oculatus]